VYQEGDTPQYVNGEFKELDPGEIAVWSLGFTMPAVSVTVYVTHWCGQAGQGLADYEGYEGPYVIAIKAAEWMEAQKPQWLRDSLDGKWIDDLWGGLGSYLLAPLKPVFWTVGWLFEKGIDVILNLFNAFMNTMKEAWDRQWAQNEGFAGMIRELTDSDGWLHNLLETPTALARMLFGPLYDELIKLPFFKQLAEFHNMLAEFLPDDWAELKNFLFNPIDYWFDKFNEWLNEEVQE
jgi:hypothetical protein